MKAEELGLKLYEQSDFVCDADLTRRDCNFIADFILKEMGCAVCKNQEGVSFVSITDCYLCKECQDSLSDGFEQAMTMDRTDTPQL